MLDVSRLSPPPAGFGRCAQCAYRDVGSVAICFACASAGMEPPGLGRCFTCDQHTQAGGRCPNYWCNRPVGERFFDEVWAIAMRSGALEEAINRYKFDDRRGWAVIFGRTLVGYLDDHEEAFNGFDTIIPAPTYLGPGARRSWDHIGRIIEKAAVEAAGRWPFYLGALPMVRKKHETPSMTGLKMRERRQLAETELRQALEVVDPAGVQGKSVLVFDDVFTEGSTLREVARSLKLAGATHVTQVVLARQPWTA